MTETTVKGFAISDVQCLCLHGFELAVDKMTLNCVNILPKRMVRRHR